MAIALNVVGCVFECFHALCRAPADIPYQCATGVSFRLLPFGVGLVVKYRPYRQCYTRYSRHTPIRQNSFEESK